VKRYLSLILALAAVFLACHSLLPRLARGPGMNVVRANLRSGVDATAYFYTDLDDFSKYEKAVRRDAARHHPLAGDALQIQAE
jgi:hypothetical protein